MSDAGSLAAMGAAKDAGEGDGFELGGGERALSPPANGAGDAIRDDGGGDRARRIATGGAGAGDAEFDMGGGENARSAMEGPRIGFTADADAGIDNIGGGKCGGGDRAEELPHGNAAGSFCTSEGAPGGGSSAMGRGLWGAGHVP